jgi:hypothetical protein
MKRLFLTLFGLCILFNTPTLAQDQLLAEIRNLAPNDVKMDGFVLDKDQEVSIRGIDAGDRGWDAYTSAWILDKGTREVVWKMHNAKRSRYTRGQDEYTDLVKLPRGEYEVYYAAFPDWSHDIEGFGELLDYLADRVFHSDSRRHEFQDLGLSIRGAGRHVGQEGVEGWHDQMRKEALVSLSGLWDNEYVRQGFILEKPVQVTLYAIGEITDDATDDYGWIINTKSGERVWQMSDVNTRHAGGAAKNRMDAESISLPAGSYAVCFATDGSHSYRDWNAAPPSDPAFWGITISVKNESERKYAKTFDFKGIEEKNLIVDLTRLGDDEFLSKGFTLEKPIDVRIYTIGEGRDNTMYDYGWILDVTTHKKIWTMEYDETEHAGGDQKNRMVNRVMHLDRGSYIVYFVTDGSHSFKDWNTAPPFDPEHWGISLSAVGEGFSAKDVSSYEERAGRSALAQIIRVGNDERRREHFTLSKTSGIHIYALGEGQSGEMADYAWIEGADTRRVVWEMTYRMTEHAGGAGKNRVFNGTISLPRGEYTVFYETDGSHAFGDWNDDPPDDSASWGVTITLAEESGH